jgi:simple sugar transport system permease protein
MMRAKSFIKSFGWPRIIIALFLLGLFVVGPFFGVKTDMSLNDVIVRFGMWATLVLSMVPMIQSGTGLNFGIPVGIIAGMIGAVMSLEFNLTGLAGIFGAFAIAIIVAAVFGWGYGLLLNKVKGDEMIIATYVGLSFMFFMNIVWLILPFKNPASVQGFKGEGLRVTISVQEYWIHKISDILQIKVTENFIIPTGMLLFFALMSLLVWGFFRTKIGTAITAVGSNPEYARASGINVNNMRTVSVILSTMIAAIGIIVYEQSFGFIQMYGSPQAFIFPSVAAILLGGASVNKASIPNVIISAISIDVSEVVRMIVTNGMIVYALTRKAR